MGHKNIVNKNYYEYIDDFDTDIFALFGGANSGKSFFGLEQWLLARVLKQSETRALVLRKIGSDSRESTIQGVLDALDNMNLKSGIHYKENKHMQNITFFNGSKIIFRGLDDPKKVKSIKGISIIIMEEASDFSLDDFNELKARLRPKDSSDTRKRQMMLMFNPIDINGWYYDEFENLSNKKNLNITMKYADNDLQQLAGKPKKWEYTREYLIDDKMHKIKTKVFQSNYDDNELLDPISKAIIEDYKRTDFKKWVNYRLGCSMQLEELVFKENEDYKVDKLDLNQFEEEFKLGMDFGFSSDPTACIKLIKCEKKKVLYIYEEVIYSQGLTNQDIAIILMSKNLNNYEVICDSAEPKSIEELKQAGIRRAIPAIKGPGSIASGIKKMQGYEIVVDPSCKNVLIELRNYKHKKSKSGKILPDVIDDYNHAIDAIRYSLSINKVKAKFY